MPTASDWAIFDRCGEEVAAWAQRQRQLHRREPSDPKPRHPVADEAHEATPVDGPPSPGWPDDGDDDPDPDPDSGRFGPN